MPDTLSLTAGVSLGLLAGIVSGVCYLVANGLARTRDEETERRCVTSGRHFCSSCGGDERGGPLPCICHRHRPAEVESGAWFLRRVRRALSLMPWSSTDKLELIEEECEPGTSGGRGEVQSVREFLEALSAKLAGGPLEGTQVAPLYDHPAYVSFFERHHSPLREQLSTLATALRDALTYLPQRADARAGGASGAHAQLRRLVARVVEEACALPALARHAAAAPAPAEHHTYEDLLATAILNKVIERYQTENGSGGRSSGIHSASASPSPSERSSPRSLPSRGARDVSPPLREEVDVSDWEEGEGVDLPRRVPFPEFGGDIVHQTDNEDRDFDEVSSSDIQAADGSWEENWLFQKKKIKNVQSVPVPMLVPNSNTDYRALIGDRDAEDTTDLSDNASDAEEQDIEFKSDVKRALDSKHVIGGKLKVEDVLDFEPDSLMSIDGSENFEKIYNECKENIDTVDAVNITFVDINNVSNENVNGNLQNSDDTNDSILIVGVDSGPLPKAEFNVKEEIHRTLINGNAESYVEQLDMSRTTEPTSINEEQSFADNKEFKNTLSRHEREGEYEETVSVPVQRYADSLRRKHFEDETKPNSTPSIEKEEELIPGSIAYRERKKWLNYVDMPNNPYSPEAIKKRLSAKSTASLFDSLTTKSKSLDDDKISDDVINDNAGDNGHPNTSDETNINNGKSRLSVSTSNINRNGRQSLSPTPRIQKNMLADEVPQYQRYGRDYYVKEAKTSAGGRNKSSYSDTCSLTSSMNKSTSLDNFETEFASPGLLIKQFNTIATNQQYKTFAGKDQTNSITTVPHVNNDEVLIEYEDTDRTLFEAKPVYVDEDTDKKFDEILETAYKTDITPLTITIDKPHDEPEKSPSNVSVENSYSSSSLEDSIKIYNVQTGEIVKCKPVDKVSPRYDREHDRNDNIDIPDRNNLGEAVDRLSASDVAAEETSITDILKVETLPQINEIEEILLQLPKVKELAKKFASMENLSEPVKPPSQPNTRRRRSRENFLSPDGKADRPLNKVAYMHSLTARSISKEFRDELKYSMAKPLTIPGGSKEIPEGTEDVSKESSRPGSPLPEPGTIKTKLAFFESLKSKFSSK